MKTRAPWGRLGPRLVAALLLALALAPAEVGAQATATITGRVTDAATGAPVVDARVLIVGTILSAVTDLRGSYRIVGAPTGAVQLQVRRVGYRPQDLTATVTAGQAATADFRLTVSIVVLEEVVTTGTAGNQTRRAQGALVADLGARELTETAPIVSVQQLLQSRVPGVSVLSASGTSGTSSQIRIRGASSINLSNEPLIYIDGVRMASGLKGPGVGGQLASRLNEIDVNQIESIELVKGPAAATLYGAEASAGVIQILTKKGRVGAGRFTQTFRVEYNSIRPNFTPPSNFANCTAALVASTSINPLCRGQEVGALVSDNPAVRGGAFRNGENVTTSWSGRGGGQNYGYQANLNWDTEDGTTANNGFDRQGGRVNFNWLPSNNLVLDVGFGINKSTLQLPDNDNNVFGFLGGSLLGSPLTRTDNGSGNDGWFGFQRDVPAISAIENTVQTHRTIATVTATYTPKPWFRNRLTVGGDLFRDESRRFFPKNDRGSYQGTANTGSLNENRVGAEVLTADYLGNIETTHANGQLTSNFSFGGQVIDSRFENVGATGLGFTVNSANVVSAASQTTGFQGFTRSRSIGLLGIWGLGWKDRRYVQVGARIDANSSFGRATDWFFLPKVDASWVISDESFWHIDAVESLRLRGAWGQTGRAPTPGAALTTLNPAPFADGAIVASGAIPLNPGNRDLKAERGSEVEAGFDLGLFDERLGLDFTYFNKVSTDVLLQVPLAPSQGFQQNPFGNVGEVLNRGVEISVNARPVNSPKLSWDLQIGASTLKNEVRDLGTITPFGTVNKVTPGRQVGAWHTNRIRSIDTLTNRVIVSDTLEFAGNVLPTFEGNLSTNLTLFGNLKLYGLIDTKTGHKVRNNTAFFRETQLVRSDNRLDPDKLSKTERLRRFGNPTAGQPAFVRENGTSATVNDVQEAYIEDADFVRLREVAVTYVLPARFAGWLGTQSAQITLAGQNLALWTDYSGFDPEVVSAANAQFNRDDFLTIPPSRRWVVRFNLTF